MTKDTFFALEEGPHVGLCDGQLDSFLSHLRAEGYARRTLRKKRSVVASFARWTLREHITLYDLKDSHVAAFVERLPRRRKARVQFELAALGPFLNYLRAQAGAPIPLALNDASPVDDLKQRYTDYLRKERGLAENSIHVYLPFVHHFLTRQVAKTGCVSPSALDAPTVRDFLLDHIHGRSSEYTRLLAVALRSFFRFLYLRGDTTIDLSLSVPTVRRWRQAEVPTFLSPEEVERVLSVTDPSTPRGCRDHAILLLLARLGLRAGEVVAMELEDIRWRSGEIVVRGKGRVLERLPLLSDIGEALALYLRTVRGPSSSRRVFLRMLAPRVGLAGPAAIGHIVRWALARAALRSPSRGAAHIFRHSLATRGSSCLSAMFWPLCSTRSPASCLLSCRRIMPGVCAEATAGPARHAATVSS